MIRNYWFTLAFLVSVSVAREAIIGGKRAKDDQFAYHVTVLSEGYDECGGGIIADDTILTAAHCVLQQHNDRLAKNQLSVLAGTNDLQKATAHVMHVLVHKAYIPKNFNRTISNRHDIAVLKLKRPMILSKHISVLKLPTDEHENYAGKQAEIAGVGYEWIHEEHDGTEIGGNNDTHLKFAVTDILSNKQCQTGYPHLTIFDTEICARVHQTRHEHRGVCTGDSGGPLVHDHTVVGILRSSPRLCSERESAAIYTRVSHYLDFVNKASGDNYHETHRFVFQ